jgi:DNA-binding transcriptional ArsR family regulator
MRRRPAVDKTQCFRYSRIMDSENLISAFGALAQETRLQVFRLLLQSGPEGVPAGEIARQLGTPANTMSTHLGILARAGLVRSHRESRQVIYAIDLDGVRGLVAFLVQECCGGQPERCAALLEAALPKAGCDAGREACRAGHAA